MKDFKHILSHKILQKMSLTRYTFVNLWTNLHIHLETINVSWQLNLFKLFQNLTINNLNTKVVLKRKIQRVDRMLIIKRNTVNVCKIIYIYSFTPISSESWTYYPNLNLILSKIFSFNYLFISKWNFIANERNYSMFTMMSIKHL